MGRKWKHFVGQQKWEQVSGIRCRYERSDCGDTYETVDQHGKFYAGYGHRT